MAVEKKGEEWKEYNRAVRWMAITVIVSLAVTMVLALIAMPLGYLVGTGISKAIKIAGQIMVWKRTISFPTKCTCAGQNFS